MAALLGLSLVAGCGDDPAPQRKAADDARDVAMVERMNQAPFKPIRPQPFTPDDLAQYDLTREGCTFRPGNKPDEPPLFVAQSDRGYLKVAGVLKPLSVKTGSAELPSGAHSTYMGLDSWIELVAQAGDESKGADGKTAWPSRLVIHDAEQRVAFNALGHVSCARQPAAGA
jgi:hypothetical protein